MAPETTYLEFSDDKSHKFYEVTLDGVEVTIRYGRIGDGGNTSTKVYATEEQAKTEATKAITGKVKKGYAPAVVGDREKRPILQGVARFNHLKRTAWTPILEMREDSPLASKYLGKPWLNPNDPGILCSSCGQPKSCHLQLNLQDVPTELQNQLGQGLIQVMVCDSEDCADVVEGSEHIRLIQIEAATNPSAPTNSSAANQGDRSNQVYQIVGWQPFDDYPTAEEAQDAHNTDYGEEGEEALFFTWEGERRKQDKLGGWPCFWQHFDGYPNCPVCQQPMQFLYLFGRSPLDDPYELMLASDCPISLFQCRVHPDQFATHMDAF